jgi:hypothetical protein
MITKVLSANDTGATGGHQAGIFVPKDQRILGYFPKLDPGRRNPRIHLTFVDDEHRRWEFAFIHYNNRLFGGTRNEYRLTRMTRYIREYELEAGDELVFAKDTDAVRRISFRRARSAEPDATGVLRLGSGWRVIPCARGAL